MDLKSRHSEYRSAKWGSPVGSWVGPEDPCVREIGEACPGGGLEDRLGDRLLNLLDLRPWHLAW
eukprot:11786717-Alexandrium_andersonii.AAC.1